MGLRADRNKVTDPAAAAALQPPSFLRRSGQPLAKTSDNVIGDVKVRDAKLRKGGLEIKQYSGRGWRFAVRSNEGSVLVAEFTWAPNSTVDARGLP
jgi:hypothetical protein